MGPLHETANPMMGFCGDGIPSKGLVRSEFCDLALFPLQKGHETKLEERLPRGVIGYVLTLDRRWEP
jgi:hypothetical protein